MRPQWPKQTGTSVRFVLTKFSTTMATLLTKPIRRETMRVTAFAGKHRGRTVIVSLEPGDLLSFRIKGTRDLRTVSLAACFNLGTIMQQEEHYKKQLDAYNDKKKLGAKRIRKPRKPYIPLPTIFFRVLG